ncbi:cysteine--tRNA ligase [Candidatus Kaiserbacteria bacterium]|nr:cysteine--tRNA ligase [Candidatus Kaiserbacteria bacterium]
MRWLARLLGGKSGASERRSPAIFLTNTLSGTKELFIPLKQGVVSLYTCGPTVYSRQHIGGLRASIFSDTLARTLAAAGYRVRRVINITDVGHLVGDGDRGQDKMSLGARREETSPAAVAERYAKLFIEDLAELNVDVEDIRFPRATDYIREQIALAKTLEEKGFAYRLPDGLYFDTQKFQNYGKLAGFGEALRAAGARVEVVPGKHSPADFALWRDAKPRDLQQWDSPWGRGNPGWHLECAAMIRALLGPQIDIHTGGEDLASVHHNNEIAESEAATGRPFVRYWMHNAFLNMGGEKISKSLGNEMYLSDIVAKGYSPLALRYFFLQAQYRTPLSFSWDALAGAQEALERLVRLAGEVSVEANGKSLRSAIQSRFLALMRDDLATPQALGLLWETLKSEEYRPEEKLGLLEEAETHLGLSLLSAPAAEAAGAELPRAVENLLARRSAARKIKDFPEADRLRTLIERSGYHVEDSSEGTVLTKQTK